MYKKLPHEPCFNLSKRACTSFIVAGRLYTSRSSIESSNGCIFCGSEGVPATVSSERSVPVSNVRSVAPSPKISVSPMFETGHIVRVRHSQGNQAALYLCLSFLHSTVQYQSR